LLGVATAYGSSQSQAPVVKTTTAGVLIDATVLDRDGHAVLDLRPDEFELAENGVRQQIMSMTLVRGGIVRSSGRTTAAPATTVQAAPAVPPSIASGVPDAGGSRAEAPPSVTAILFDRLSAETRPLARRAALAYVSTLSPPHDYAGVFLADIALQTFQLFTNQAESLRQAVDRVAATAPANLSPAVERAANPRIQDLDPSQPVTPGAESSAGWINALERERRLSLPSPAGDLIAMELRMWQGYRQFLEEYGGQSSLAGLRSVVDGLSVLRGRKSILYFSEDLLITARLKSRFDELIGAANRGNVTVYAVDAAGLRIHSREAEVSRNVSVAGAQGVGDARRDDGPWTKELERQEQVLSSRPAASLGRLAKETGGFLLENTNDLAAGVARMQQERTTYYLLTYQSTNAALDGTFRRVSVKVNRPKTTVKARSGYLALPPPH
jgi:VWFA-related protein